MADSSSPSTSTGSSNRSTPRMLSDKCQVCFQKSHGNHFGVDSCRACAAFFRRIFITHKQQFPCIQANDKCQPINGRWDCKKCRIARCFAIGMKPDNIQRDRDLHASSQKLVSCPQKRKRTKTAIPVSMERCLGENHVRLYLYKEEFSNVPVSYFDVSFIAQKANTVLNINPLMSEKEYSLSSLRKLALGLNKIRSHRDEEQLFEMPSMGKQQLYNHWVREIDMAGTFFMHFNEFRELDITDKLEIFKCIWIMFTKLERFAKTAEMRVNRICDNNQFVYTSNKFIDYDNLQLELAWLSKYPTDEIKYFVGPFHQWFDDSLVASLIELKLTDVELSYLICNLCFHITGKSLGGRIQTITDRLQDQLANDLHNYYLETDKSSRYSYRLAKVLNINKIYQQVMYRKKERMFLADTLNVFNVRMSHPDFFKHAL